MNRLMIHRCVLLVLVSVLLVFVPTSPAQDAPVPEVPDSQPVLVEPNGLVLSNELPMTDGLWFPVGEKLVYKVYWGLISVGTSVATTEWVEHEGRRLISIKFRTRSNKVLSTIYPVDDTIETLVDPDTFLPVRFRKKMSEGHHRADETFDFDYENLVLTRTKNLTGKVKQFPIKSDTRDLVAFMYHLRGQAAQFEVGVNKVFEVLADEKLYEVNVKPLKEEMVKLPHYGKVKSTRFEPTATFNGLFVRKGKLSLWASSDERRILTKIQAKVPVASVKILLVNVEGPGDDFWIKNQNKAAITKSGGDFAADELDQVPLEETPEELAEAQAADLADDEPDQQYNDDSKEAN